MRYEYRVRGNNGETWEDSPYTNLTAARRGLAECRHWEREAYKSDSAYFPEEAVPEATFWIERRPVAKWERV